MKLIPLLIATLSLSSMAMADDYSVFHVCQDRHIIHTSDGADAGHIEYIVMDPGSRQIVSTIITGGVIGEKYVAVPYESVRYGPEQEMMLTEINRERITSAPVIERSQLTSTTRVLQPTVFESSSQHFGVRFDAHVNIRDEDRRDGDRRDGELRDGRRTDSFRADATLNRRDGDRRYGELRDGRRTDSFRADATLNRRDGDRDRADPDHRDAATRERDGRRNDPSAPPSSRARSESETSQERNATLRSQTEAAAKSRPGSDKAHTQGLDSKEGDTKLKASRSDPDAPPAGRAKAESAQERNAGSGTRSDPTESTKSEAQRTADNAGAAAHKVGANAERTADKDDHTAQKTGEKAERTADKVGDKAEHAADKVDHTAQKTGEKPERTADKVGDKAEHATDKAGHAAEKTGEKVGRTAEKAGTKAERNVDRTESKAAQKVGNSEDGAKRTPSPN